MDKQPAETRTREVPCPRCGIPCPYVSANPWRPFCSERCKMIDLGQWAAEAYRVPESAEPSAENDTLPQ